MGDAAAIWTTIIGSVCGVIVVLLPLLFGLKKARRENRDQHSSVEVILGQLTGKVEVMHDDVKSVRRRLDDHIDRHEALPTGKIESSRPRKASSKNSA